MTKLLTFGLSKYVGLRRRLQHREAQRFTSTYTPELAHAYQVFAEASQSGASRQPLKGRDLWRILQAAAPTSIVELGSGTTSAVFALWAKRYRVPYVAYEHDQHWARITADCLRRTGLDGADTHVRFVPSRVRADHKATGFVQPIPLEADFVYVDGPPCRLENGAKVPNDDIARLLDAGGRPRTIVVDGRIDTVDVIRAHPGVARYRFLPSYVYSLRRHRWRDVVAGREHSILVRT